MKTLLLCFLVLAVRLVSSNKTTPEGACSEHAIICQFMGKSWTTTYEFNVDDLQNALSRCQIVLYGQFYFDRSGIANTHVFESDKNALRALNQCGKTVYIVVGFSTSSGWAQVLEPEDQTLYDYYLNSLTDFIKKYKISGVIFEYTLNVLNTDYPHTAEAITSFVNDIKSGVDSLKVGMILFGSQYDSFSDSNIFDIGQMNTVMDYIVIDMTALNMCDAETRCESLSPVRSQNNKLITMETVSSAVQKSPIDKCKVVAMLLVSVAEPLEDSIANNDPDIYGTYTELCTAANSGKDFVKRWCFATTTILYDQGKFAREHFPSLMINTIEADDTGCVCGCPPFVATNSILDGWECNVLQPCPGLDNLLN